MTADQALPLLPADSNALPFFFLVPSSPPFLPSLPPVMYYECCLITQPRNLHTGWHIYLFALYLFVFLLYAKSFCDRVVYSLALPSWDQTTCRLNRDGVRLMVNPRVDCCCYTPRGGEEVLNHASGGTCLSASCGIQSIPKHICLRLRNKSKNMFCFSVSLPSQLCCPVCYENEICMCTSERPQFDLIGFNTAILFFLICAFVFYHHINCL